ncbi:MAG TPA: DUF6569 family protein, partial [Chitinophagaceae bacterium]|nr:DUF6569 family protein [Chitinophagaceae bacterium]
MQRLFMLLGILIPVTIFSQEYSYRTLDIDFNSEPQTRTFTYKNLRLYPIKAKAVFKQQTSDISNYTSLKEALEKKKILITEKEGRNESAEVNTLYAQNTSRDTLYLMAGE